MHARPVVGVAMTPRSNRTSQTMHENVKIIIKNIE